MAAIFNLQLNDTMEGIGVCSIVLATIGNMGIATEISLISCIQPELRNYFRFPGLHLETQAEIFMM